MRRKTRAPSHSSLPFAVVDVNRGPLLYLRKSYSNSEVLIKSIIQGDSLPTSWGIFNNWATGHPLPTDRIGPDTVLAKEDLWSLKFWISHIYITGDLTLHRHHHCLMLFDFYLLFWSNWLWHYIHISPSILNSFRSSLAIYSMYPNLFWPYSSILNLCVSTHVWWWFITFIL